MKKEYKKPSIQSFEKSEKWAPAAALLAGYVVGRAVTQAVGVDRLLKKVGGLPRVLTEVK